MTANYNVKVTAAAGGVISTELRAKIDTAAQGFTLAKAKMGEFTAEMKAMKPAVQESGGALDLATKGAEALGVAMSLETKKLRLQPPVAAAVPQTVL